MRLRKQEEGPFRGLRESLHPERNHSPDSTRLQCFSVTDVMSGQEVRHQKSEAMSGPNAEGVLRRTHLALSRLQTTHVPPGASDLPLLPSTQRLQYPDHVSTTGSWSFQAPSREIPTWPGTGSARLLPGPATSASRRRSQPGPHSAGRRGRAGPAHAEGQRPGPAHESIFDCMRLHHVYLHYMRLDIMLYSYTGFKGLGSRIFGVRVLGSEV